MKLIPTVEAINRPRNSKDRTQKWWRFAKVAAIAMVGCVLAGGADLRAAPLPGAIFTTEIDPVTMACSGVNINIYGAKIDVYLDGGPTHPGAASLPDGAYFVKVTNPSGSDLLGTSVGTATPQPFVVSNGEPLACYQLWAILKKDSDGSQGYDNTPNPGGEYKVWVSTVATFDNPSSKTDNFKAPNDTDGGGGGPGGDPLMARLCVEKFYDANVNGVADIGEVLLNGWKVLITDGISLTRFTPVCVILEATEPKTQVPLYNVFEYSPIETNWIHTTPQTVNNIGLPPDADPWPLTVTVTFGNVCIGPGGGMTLGFWSNKNGQRTMNDGGTLAPELALLSGTNLRNASGADFDPATYDGFRTWLLGANAKNMSYMLSAQLAAMILNTEAGKVGGGAVVYAPAVGITSAGLVTGFLTINDLLGAANTELGNHGAAVSGTSYRAYQEALKNALDDANNNKNFLQAAPCPFTFADQ